MWKNQLKTFVVQKVKKFHSGCKNLDDQVWPGRAKTMDSKVVLQAIESNLVSITCRVSGELSIPQSSLMHHNLGKALNCASHYQNIPKYFTPPSEWHIMIM